MTLGERVRELRTQRGWSQYLLADFSGLSQPTISLIERDGNARIGAFKCVALALEIPLSRLFEGVEIDDPFGR